MEILICPECGVKNLQTAENCRSCSASLRDVEASEISDSAELIMDELDLLPQSENDLPGLFQNLKENGELGEDGEDQQEYQDPSSPESTDIFATDEAEDDQVVPDWLHRIRQRANEDPDSIGEITQKISAAQESLAAEMSDSQHQDFEAWIRSLRDESGEEKRAVVDEPANISDTEPEWLKKIRKEKDELLDDQGSEHGGEELDQKGDSLLQWLVALEDGEGFEPIPEDEYHHVNGETTRQTIISPQEDQDDTTQEIRMGSPEAELGKKRKLEISRQEKTLADQLLATIVDETAVRPVREAKSSSSTWVIRLLMAILLIGGISLSLIFGGGSDVSQVILQPHNQALLSWCEALPSDASLLLVLDYQPGFSPEISLIAQPLLRLALQAQSQVSIIASKPSGLLLFRQLFNEIDFAEEPTVIDLGYYPLGSFAAYRVGNRGLDEKRIEFLPEPAKPLPSGDYEGILILSDSYEGARVWVEQLNVANPDMPINLLTTAQAGPMLMPYWESGQVTGLVSGLSEAAGIESALEQDTSIADRWGAYQTGTLILIVMMVIGSLVIDEGNSEDEGKGGA